MKITVRTIGRLQSLVGSAELEVELPSGSRVSDLLRTVGETCGAAVARDLDRGADGRVPLSPRVLVNGRDIGALDGRATVLSDGDDVLILTPMAGG
jgi:molybdopterin converting factor small subunit